MIFATRERLHCSYHSVFNTSRIESIIRRYFGNSYRNENSYTIPLFPQPETYERLNFKTSPRFYRICGRTYDREDLK
jgi:hypothetical protein